MIGETEGERGRGTECQRNKYINMQSDRHSDRQGQRGRQHTQTNTKTCLQTDNRTDWHIHTKHMGGNRQTDRQFPPEEDARGAVRAGSPLQTRTWTVQPL